MGDNEWGDLVARAPVAFWCAKAIVTRPVVPEIRDCQGCGLPAGRDRVDPQTAALAVTFKTHLALERPRPRESLQRRRSAAPAPKRQASRGFE